jgi:NHLM bacteriocin system ABC transporter ATP-binding protein
MSAGTTDNLQQIHGNTTLVLHDPELCWKIETGSIAVFGVRVENGVPCGARRFLFSCGAGDVLVGATNGEQSLMCVGLGDAAVREMSLAQYQAEHPGRLLAALQDWVSHIVEVLRGGTDAIHADPFPAGLVRLEAGQAAKPAEPGLAWARVVTGRVTPLGLPGRSWQADDGWLPINEDCPLRAGEPAELEIVAADALYDVAAMARGVALLHDSCFRSLAARQAAEDAREARRLQESRKLLQVDTAESVRGMLNLLTPDKTLPLRETPLLSALAALEPHLGVSFKVPVAGDSHSEAKNSIDAVAASSHIRIRRVRLPAGWWNRDGGPLLGFRGQDSRPVALFRTKRWLGLFGKYMLFDPVEQIQTAVTREIDGTLSPEAVSFVRPLPTKKASSLFSLIKFTISRVWREGLLLLGLALLTALVGMLQPMATRMLVDKAIPEADLSLLTQMAVGLVAMAIGTTAFSISQSMIAIRLSTMASSGLQSALFDRLLRLPQSFFRRFSTGDLANRAMMVNEVSSELNGAALSAVLSGVMSLLNLRLCYVYAPQLAWIAVAVALLTAVSAVVFSLPIRRKALAMERLSGVLDGLSVQLVSGISKLRVSGSEQRAFNFWSRKYAEQLQLGDQLQRLSNWSSLLNMVIDTGSLTFLFYYAAKSLAEGASAGQAAATVALTMGTFLAFYSAFNSVVDGIVGVTNKIIEVMDSWAKRELITPLLDAQPETDEGSINPGVLNGKIALDNVVFRYHPDAPLILNGISLEVLPGEFAAIVGPSGCGKSTIFKLLLGFDAPESGKVYFDGQDLASLDKAVIRRQMGTVIQAGRINAGPIFEAIAAGAQITLDQAWEAARDAGFEDDLKSMPMGMHTVVPEGATTLSGGQRQRLLIARALVRNPRILLFDEATSALDNRTQEIVSRSLERRRVTRIVIAHRLSTIRDANRIFVLEGGVVKQAGTFDELMAQDGLFRRLASRQMA